jgi:hypothetical protein
MPPALQIDGVLMPPDGPASWPAADSRRQWLVFYKADGVTLAGKGTIEGNGEEWWDLPCKPHRVRGSLSSRAAVGQLATGVVL